MTLDRDELRQLASEAKPLPYAASRMEGEYIVYSTTAQAGRNGVCSMWCSGHYSGNIQTHEPTWQYLVAACNAIPMLLDQLAAVEAEVARLKEEMESHARQSMATVFRLREDLDHATSLLFSWDSGETMCLATREFLRRREANP